MRQAVSFDVAIVYAEKEAQSAPTKKSTAPFSLRGKNRELHETYSFFLAECHKNGLTACLSTTKDIDKKGLLKKAWVFEKKWKHFPFPVQPRMVFDKFLPRTKQLKQKRALLQNGKKTLFFTNERLLRLFTDKLLTYRSFPSLAIPTVPVHALNKKGIENAKKKLARLTAKKRFGHCFSGEFVLKDRFGFGGRHIFKIDFKKKQGGLLKKLAKKGLQFVLQPFVLFDQSQWWIGKRKGPMDLRLLMLNGQLAQAYVRKPKKGDFRCNTSQGGTISYLKTKRVPAKIRKLADKTAKTVPKQSFFSLDFLQSNNGRVFLVEGNATPGLNWEPSNRKDRWQTRKLIQKIIQTIAKKTVLFQKKS